MAMTDGSAANLDGANGNLTLGGEGAEGDLALLNADGGQTFYVDGGEANLWIGGEGAEGDIVLRNAAGEQTIHLDGGEANLLLGGGGDEGDLLIRDGDGEQTIHLDGGEANLWIGGNGRGGDIAVRDKAGETSIHLDGGEGVIRVRGAAVPTADHVFTPAHRLPTLAEVEAEIRTRGHLPGIASAETMRAEGLDLVQFSGQLLAKIEELTLYILEQERRIRALEGR